jgi:hypothetical protein
MVARPKILFRGTFNTPAEGHDSSDSSLKEYAILICKELGAAIMREGFDLILTGTDELEATVGESAVKACQAMSISARERIRTYLRSQKTAIAPRGFGMSLRPLGGSTRHLRTQCVSEASAVVGLMGGAGTSDCILTSVDTQNRPLMDT